MRHKGVSFNQLDDRNMSRIRYLKVSEETGEEVPSEQIVKGVEISKGRYVIVDPDELAPFVPLATKTIEVEEFVNLAEIDPIYFETSYYVAPHLTTKPYALLAKALESAGKVAIVRFVMRSRQYTAALRADEGRLVLSTLAYADEIVPVDEVEDLAGLDKVDVSDREVKMAEMLVESLTRTFDRIRVQGWQSHPSRSSATPGCPSTPLTRCPRRCRPRPSRPSASSRAGSSST